ncbi:MAG: dfa3 1 [Acidimicrobiaceae bacterium]|jgi:3-hydroxy-9,10-secoandrosta-1,3,5(10)-triene-9,17-dione monooxygenase reductase component|nr:dfa3 1 [Acidimicrobiaceae bacterium]
MAPHARAVGPFPDGVDPDEYDRLRRRVLWKLPTGLYLLGSRAGDRRNLMTCNLVSQLAMEPKLVGVAVERDAVTLGLVRDGGSFALALLDREDRAVVRVFAKPAVEDRSTHTLSGVAYRDAPVTGAPIPEIAAAFLDCRLEREVDLGSHVLCVGEVLAAGFGERGEDAEILRSEDTRMNYGG